MEGRFGALSSRVAPNLPVRDDDARGPDDERARCGERKRPAEADDRERRHDAADETSDVAADRDVRNCHGEREVEDDQRQRLTC